MGQRDEVIEVIGGWSRKKNEVRWKGYKVKCQKNVEYLQTLIDDSVPELVKMWFPENSPYLQRPEGVGDLEWSNHKNSLIGMISEIKQFFIEESTYTELMLDWRPEVYS